MVVRNGGVLMSKVLQFSVFALFIFLAGCSGISSYEDNEAVAIVKGQEITVGDLRFLYPDNTAFDYLDWTITVELVKQKVEEMDLSISDNLSEGKEGGWFGELPAKDTIDEGGKAIRTFAKSQAKKLGMTPEDFQREYAKKIEAQNAYLATYFDEMLGMEAFDAEKGLVDFNDEMNRLLEELVEKNADEIEVLIQ